MGWYLCEKCKGWGFILIHRWPFARLCQRCDGSGKDPPPKMKYKPISPPPPPRKAQ